MWNSKRLCSFALAFVIFFLCGAWFGRNHLFRNFLSSRSDDDTSPKTSYFNPESWSLQKLPLVRNSPQETLSEIRDTFLNRPQTSRNADSKISDDLKGTSTTPTSKIKSTIVLKTTISKPELVPKIPRIVNNYENKIDISASTGSILTKVGSKWVKRPDLCHVQPDFVLSRLSRPANTPIYVYARELDEYVSGSILNGGMWESDLVYKVYHLLQKDPEAAFLDIGANIGVFSLTMAKLGREVFSIDCLKSNVMRLCASVKLGNLSDRVTIIYNALSYSRENVTLGTYKGNVGGTYVKKIDSQGKNNENLEVVSTILLDDLLDIFKAKKVVIKMDVETFEANVLKGADRFFSTVHVLYIIMEFKVHRGKESGNFIVDFLYKHGLEPDFGFNSGVNPKDTNTWPVNVSWKRKGL